MTAAGRSVSILLLGSGWTSRFLLPRLQREGITHACTSRQPQSSAAASDGGQDNTFATSFPRHAIQFDTAGPEGESSEARAQRLQRACAALPTAQMVVVVFPLVGHVPQLVQAYEAAKGCRPAWLALGSTGAWGKGTSFSTTPVLPDNARAMAEASLLAMHGGDDDEEQRQTSVLNLAGLYGHQRNPANFVKRVADSKEKLSAKTSVHFVHGQDVAKAIVEMYKALQDQGKRSRVWGRRWIVTDTHVYDWWQLVSTLRPATVPQAQEWAQQLMSEHRIARLPRPEPGHANDEDQGPPRVLERALRGTDFWQALGVMPDVGRCDDYGAGGGGIAVESSL